MNDAPKSPPTIQQVAKHWQNGVEEARRRLTESIEKDLRFDARDREALAFLLAQPSEKPMGIAPSVTVDGVTYCIGEVRIMRDSAQEHEQCHHQNAAPEPKLSTRNAEKDARTVRNQRRELRSLHRQLVKEQERRSEYQQALRAIACGPDSNPGKELADAVLYDRRIAVAAKAFVYNPDDARLQQLRRVVRSLVKGLKEHDALKAEADRQREEDLYSNTGPTFNHTRDDGPYHPCPECLSKMSPQMVAAYVDDLKETISDMEDELAREPEGAGNPSEVWIVTHWDAHSETVEGIFATEALAKEHMQSNDPGDSYIGRTLRRHTVKGSPSTG